MRLFAKVTVFVGLVLIGTSPGAAADRAAVEHMLEVGGFYEAVEGVDEQFRTGAEDAVAQYPALPADAGAKLVELFGTHFTGEALMVTMQRVLEETLTDQEVSTVTAFYETDFGEMIREQEVTFARAQAGFEERIPNLLAELEAQPDRAAIYEDIDQTLLGTEANLSATFALMRAMAVSIFEIQGVDPSEVLAIIEAQIDANRPVLRDAIADYVKAAYAETYRSLSDDEMNRYVAFLKSDESRALYSALLAASHEFFETSGARLGADFSEYLTQVDL